MTEYDRPDDMTEWVPEVGDKAVILGRSGRGVASNYNDVTVERLTKTQIVTSDGSRFCREKRLGEYEMRQARDAWAVPSILVSEDSTRAKKARVATAAARIRRTSASAMPAWISVLPPSPGHWETVTRLAQASRTISG